jgi:N-acetylglucosaminyldiphosphoundecaprenol N-acetyl-beta-D-mannosaminyltransferase
MRGMQRARAPATPKVETADWASNRPQLSSEDVENPEPMPSQLQTEAAGTPALDAAVAAVPATGRPAPQLANERRVHLFGLHIADTDIPSAAAWIVLRARHRLATEIAFLNAHCVNVMRSNPAYRDALSSMSRVFADGIGVRIAARITGVSLQDNVNGTDLFPVLCKQAAAAGIGLYLFGAAPGVAEAAGRNMQAVTPGLGIAGTHHGYLEDPEAQTRAIEAINASSAAIVLVALGVPTQELWIARNRHRLTAPVVIGVGGLFDYYSGRIERAPLAIRNVGMEWAWRLAQEPRRLAKRYVVGNAEFMARLIWERLRSPAAFNRRPAA